MVRLGGASGGGEGGGVKRGKILQGNSFPCLMKILSKELYQFSAEM